VPRRRGDLAGEVGDLRADALWQPGALAWPV